MQLVCDRRLGVAVCLLGSLARGRGASVGDRPTAPDLWVTFLTHGATRQVQKTTRAIDNMGFRWLPCRFSTACVMCNILPGGGDNRSNGRFNVASPSSALLRNGDRLGAVICFGYFNIFVLSTAGAAGYTLGERTEIGNALSPPVPWSSPSS